MRKQSPKHLARIVHGLDQNAADANAEQQPNVFFMPGISTVPCWRDDKLKSHPRLTSALSTIQEKYTSILEECNNLQRTEHCKLWRSNTSESGQWKTFYLYNQGKKVEENCKFCPETVCLLNQAFLPFMKDCIFGNALFSIVEPGTIITEHYGPTNIRLRCHLGQYAVYKVFDT